MSMQRMIGIAVMVAVVGLVLAGPAMAKRAAPEPVKPITIDGVTYRARHDQVRSKGKVVGFAAMVEASPQRGQPWVVEVYRVAYDPELETDVQDVYIVSLTKGDGSRLIVTDERGRRFAIDTKTQKVVPLPERS